MRSVALLLLLVLLSGGTPGCSPEGGRSPRTIRVLAASCLAFAAPDLARELERTTGLRASFSLASTGKLAAQIEQGAPWDVFMAADRAHVRLLAEAGLVDTGSIRTYAEGRLVLWTPPSASQPPADLDALAATPGKRVAIANPAHAPYGIAAKAALVTRGVWDTLRPRVVMGENVQQALRYARDGNVDAAIVPLSLAIHVGAGYTPIPPELYPPMRQDMAAAEGARAGARRFLDFVTEGPGRAVLQAHGFDTGPWAE